VSPTNHRRDQFIDIALCLICLFAFFDLWNAIRRPGGFPTFALANDLVLIGLVVAAANRLPYSRVALGTVALLEGTWLADTALFTLLTDRSYYFGTRVVMRYLVIGATTAFIGGLFLFAGRARSYFAPKASAAVE
jgi:hypothetical protein